MKINSLYIELTSQCNFRCETCYNRSGQHKVRFLPWESLYLLLEQLPSSHVSCAGGEPLLYPHMDSLLQYMEQHPARTFSLVTNGSIHWILPYYALLPNLRLQVSLDGSLEEINARTRGAGHFDTTADFIRKAASIRPLTVKMVISGHNHLDVEPFYRYIADLGCKPVFSFVNNSGSALDHWESLQVSVSRKVEILKLLAKLGEEYHMESPLPYCTQHCSLLDPEEPWNLLITPDGRIQPCQSLYDPAFTLGTPEDLAALGSPEDFVQFGDPEDFAIQRIPEILIQRMTAIQEKIRTRSTLDYNCRRCFIRSRCDRGCPALAFNHHADFMACDEQCDFRKQQFLLLMRC